MLNFSRLRSWMRAVVFRDSHRREVDGELRFHLEQEVEALIASGLARPQAEQLARARFGNLDALREECREARGTRLVDTTAQDLRYGVRMLLGNPGFSLTAILTLAFTIGAVSTVMTLVHTFYLQRWPVERPEQIVKVEITRDEGTRVGRATWGEYLHFRDNTETLQCLIAAYTTAPLYLTTDEDSSQVNGAVVSANFFPTLGLRPALGRFFTAEEDSVPDRDRFVVIGHELWRNRVGGDPGVVGTDLLINGTTFAVIGVAPASFAGFDGTPVQIYMPMMMIGVGYRWCSVLEEIDCTILEMYGRLADGASIVNANAEIQSLRPLHWANADRGDNSGAVVREVRDNYQSGVDEQFMRLLVVVGVVLFLVCCANLAGLLISRGRARSAELAVRTSLGASRLRIVRQLLTEALLLSVVGGSLGALLSLLLTRGLQARFYAFDSSGRPLSYDFVLRPEILAATVGVALAAGLLFGLLPAWGARSPAHDTRARGVIG